MTRPRRIAEGDYRTTSAMLRSTVEKIKKAKIDEYETIEETILRLIDRSNASKEIDRLANFLLKHYPHEIGKGNPIGGESAVDVALRLIEQVERGGKKNV